MFFVLNYELKIYFHSVCIGLWILGIIDTIGRIGWNQKNSQKLFFVNKKILLVLYKKNDFLKKTAWTWKMLSRYKKGVRQFFTSFGTNHSIINKSAKKAYLKKQKKNNWKNIFWKKFQKIEFEKTSSKYFFQKFEKINSCCTSVN